MQAPLTDSAYTNTPAPAAMWRSLGGGADSGCRHHTIAGCRRGRGCVRGVCACVCLLRHGVVACVCGVFPLTQHTLASTEHGGETTETPHLAVCTNPTNCSDRVRRCAVAVAVMGPLLLHTTSQSAAGRCNRAHRRECTPVPRVRSQRAFGCVLVALCWWLCSLVADLRCVWKEECGRRMRRSRGLRVIGRRLTGVCSSSFLV